MRDLTTSGKWIISILCLTIPSAAWANAGLPMIVLVVPAMLWALIPIIVVEAFYLEKSLDLPRATAAKCAAISNAISTIIGVPLTWLALVIIQMITGGGQAYGLDSFFYKMLAVTWQAPWLIPYESDLDWMVPIAGLSLLVPFFFVSWWIEYLIVRFFVTNRSHDLIKRKVRNANLISYGLLALWPITVLTAS